MTGSGARVRIGGRILLAAALAAALASCSSPPMTVFDLTPAHPPAARPLAAQIRFDQPVATADLDSERILVRNGQELALLPGARWPQQLTTLFRDRLVESFQNAGLARWVDGGAASANYALDINLRAFELDAATSEAHVEAVAKIVSLTSGRIVDVAIHSERVPVVSAAPAAVVAALGEASDAVMTDIVKFVARRL
jgi:cholesterol transport system auxiliary component